MSANIINLVDMIDKVSLKYSQRTALIFGAKEITYAQLSSNSKRLSSKLAKLGVDRGDKVGIWLSNCPEFVFSFFAVLRLGAVVVPINTMFKREEARFIVEDSAAKILICSIDKVSDSENILSRGDSLRHIISLPSPLDSVVVHDFYNLINLACEFNKEISIKGDDFAQIIYTSGTTGHPKGACLSHKNLLSNIEDCTKVIRVTKRDCVICVLPLFHSFASTVCMLLPLANGGRILIMKAVRPFKRVLRGIFKHKVTIFTGVPSFYSILGEAKFPFRKLLLMKIFSPIRLYISGAAALPFTVWERFEKKFNRPLLQGYGLTEAAPVVSLNPLRGNKPQSVGRPLPSVRVKVAGKKGEELAIGEVGELLVKGPNVMGGYYNLETANKEVFNAGWLCTGDLAKLDNQGFVYIMGREKEMINVRGLNVYPREIEDILYQYPKVKEAAVVGVFHLHRGEVPVAFVVKEGEITEKEVINYLRNNLASYKVPLKVFFRDSLPKNPTGKILKKELQQEVEEIFLKHEPAV